MDTDDFDCKLEMTFNEVDHILEYGLDNEYSVSLEEALETMFGLAMKLKRCIVCKLIVNPPI